MKKTRFVIINVATILLGSLSSSVLYADYNSADLKTLFTDREQRAQIDAIRSGKNTSVKSPQTTRIKVSGYVTRSDGKSVVWVNSKNTLESSTVGNVKVYQSSVGANKKVTLSVDGKTRRLKPGETWHKETGKIVDSQ
jgi:hypothetical protein